jgi:hypothetical protein
MNERVPDQNYAIVDSVGIVWTGSYSEMLEDFNNAEILHLKGDIKLVQILKEKKVD